MTLVPAQPAAEQAAHFARLAQIAGDEIFTHFFGSRAETVLASMFRRRENDNSHAHTAFLLEEDAIAGMLQAYTASDARQQAPRTLWLYLRYAAWQLPRALVLGFMLRDILDFLNRDLDDEDFYIVFLALYPPYRGQGHSKTLLREAERRAVLRGCRRLILDVDERNHVALAAYSRVGFEQIAQSKKVELAGERIGLLRLAKPVAPSPAPMAPAM